MASNELNIIPQKGFQEKVFACSADIAIIGGQAGGGKTMALIAEPMKWTHVKDFSAVFFRRDKERIRATGGLLAESKKWYIEAELKETILKWVFPSGAMVDFEGIEYTKDLDKWLGTQIPLIIFDEVTEFEEEMFWFMISRNRGIVRWSENGKKFKLKPYVRASCNPKPNSWVSRLIEWWIDQDSGFPIEERDGVIRYFIRYKDKMYWGDTKDDVILSCPEVFENMKKIDSQIDKYDLIKSFTFIRGRLAENKALLRNSPEYYSSLLSLSDEDQMRYLEGNWKASSDGRDLFDFGRCRNLFVNESYDDILLKNGIESLFITCDAAKFGQDLCVIYVWSKWTVIHTTVFCISDSQDIYREIELLRQKFKIGRSQVIIDQDGLGGDVVRLGHYKGFIARQKPIKDPDLRISENYDSFKDQCYFLAASRVNSEECKFIFIRDNVKIFDRGSKNPRYSYKVKHKGDLVDIRNMIIEHLMCIKKADTVYDGGEAKYKINHKDEQRELLGGASPDFADAVCMRAAFDLEKRRRGKTRLY